MPQPFGKMLAWFPLMAVSAAVAVYCWQLPARPIALRVSAASSDQVRITWDRTSAPALLARGGVLEIRDAGTVRRLPLTAGQVRDGSVTYGRESGDVRVRFTIETRDRWARLQALSETAEFRGGPVPLRPARPRVISQTLREAAPAPAGRPPQGNADRVETPRRAAVIPANLPAPFSRNASIAVPVPPPVTLSEPGNQQFTIAAPPTLVAPPPRALYSGPRSGRMIWTGSMGRHGVVEIEGTHANIGSLSGGLPGVAVTIRVSPAEFSPQGLLVHSSDAAANNRREAASAANGWNATFFRWEPGRAQELVVLEAPNPTNEYKRLVVRNEARSCSVMLVEWSVRAQ